MMNCECCGSKMDEDSRCPVCKYGIEDRMNFSGVHFYFAYDEMRRRHYKELPYPTRESRCELCWFAIPDNDIPGASKLISCHLANIGFCHDTGGPMFFAVRPTGTCKRFKKRRAGSAPVAREMSIKFIVPGIDRLSIKIIGKLKIGTVNDALDKIVRYFRALGYVEKVSAIEEARKERAFAGDDEIDLAMPIKGLSFRASRSLGMEFLACTISFMP